MGIVECSKKFHDGMISMSNSNHVIIGAITSNLSWDDVKVWYSSARASGYSDDMVLLVYDVGANDQLMNDISNHGIKWEIIRNNQEIREINTFMYYRFKWIREYLLRNQHTAHPYKWVCITDVNDVVFQGDISISGPQDLMVGGENLTYKDEPWSRANMIGCFGSDQFIELRDKEIVCAGVMLGPVSFMLGFLMLLFALSKSASPSPNGGGPDQAALNILIREVDWGNKQPIPNNAWVAHLGTHPVAIANKSGDVGLSGENFDNKFIAESHGIQQPKTGEYQIISHITGLPVAVVHQYNRISYLKEYFRNKYE